MFKQVILYETDYLNLQEKADANDETLKQMAEDMAKKKDTTEITLCLSLNAQKDNKYAHEKLKIAAKTNHFNWPDNGTCPFDPETKKQLDDFLKQALLDTAEQEFGDLKEAVDKYLEEKDRIRRKWHRFAWAAAFAVVASWAVTVITIITCAAVN